MDEEALLGCEDENDDGEEVSSDLEDDLLNRSSDSESDKDNGIEVTKPNRISNHQDTFEPDYEDDVLVLSDDDEIEESEDDGENRESRESKFTSERPSKRLAEKGETSEARNEIPPPKELSPPPKVQLQKSVDEPVKKNGSNYKPIQPRHRRHRHHRHYEYQGRPHINNTVNNIGGHPAHWDKNNQNNSNLGRFVPPWEANRFPELLSLNFEPPRPPLLCLPQPPSFLSFPNLSPVNQNSYYRPQPEFVQFPHNNRGDIRSNWNERIPEFRPHPPPPDFTIPPPPLPPNLRNINPIHPIGSTNPKPDSPQNRLDDDSVISDMFEDVEDYQKRMEQQKRAKEEVLRLKEQRRPEGLNSSGITQKVSPKIVLKRDFYESDSSDDLSKFKIKVAYKSPSVCSETESACGEDKSTVSTFKNRRIILKNAQTANKDNRNYNAVAGWTSGSIVKNSVQSSGSGFFSNRKIITKDIQLRKTRMVSVKNVSMSSVNHLMSLVNKDGSVQKFQFDPQDEQVNILFTSVPLAHVFFKKYNGFVLDLKPIEVLLEPMI